MKKNIIYVKGNQTFINNSMETKLEEAGFHVISVATDMSEVQRYRNEADIILYHPDNNQEIIEQMMTYLTKMCMNDHKSLCLLGDNIFISYAMKHQFANWVSHTYVRPINFNEIAEDMNALSKAHAEYRREKKLLIVDDDDDFRTIMAHWLGNIYHVDSAASGTEAINIIDAGANPDLILLDYEMPEFDGNAVMEKLHRNPLTKHIPIIFLTGRNDRETITQVLSKKPDGYLLKTVKKTELLDRLDRFFAESILRSHSGSHTS